MDGHLYRHAQGDTARAAGCPGWLAAAKEIVAACASASRRDGRRGARGILRPLPPAALGRAGITCVRNLAAGAAGCWLLRPNPTTGRRIEFLLFSRVRAPARLHCVTSLSWDASTRRPVLSKFQFQVTSSLFGAHTANQCSALSSSPPSPLLPSGWSSCSCYTSDLSFRLDLLVFASF